MLPMSTSASLLGVLVFMATTNGFTRADHGAAIERRFQFRPRSLDIHTSLRRTEVLPHRRPAMR